MLDFAVLRSGTVRIELVSEEYANWLLKADLSRVNNFGPNAVAHLARGHSKDRKVVFIAVPLSVTSDALKATLANTGRPVEELRRPSQHSISNVFVTLASSLHAKSLLDKGHFYMEKECVRLRVEKPRVQKLAEVLCFRCSEYGHFQRTCEATKPRCGHCAGAHHKRNCPVRSDPVKATCPLCEGSHPAGNRQCPAKREAPDFAAAEERRRKNNNSRRPRHQQPPRINPWTQRQSLRHAERMAQHRYGPGPGPQPPQQQPSAAIDLYATRQMVPTPNQPST